jgi:hypothetical protein
MNLVWLLAATMILGSCKKKFDEPPGPTDPPLTATHTI